MGKTEATPKTANNIICSCISYIGESLRMFKKYNFYFSEINRGPIVGFLEHRPETRVQGSYTDLFPGSPHHVNMDYSLERLSPYIPESA